MVHWQIADEWMAHARSGEETVVAAASSLTSGEQRTNEREHEREAVTSVNESNGQRFT